MSIDFTEVEKIIEEEVERIVREKMKALSFFVRCSGETVDIQDIKFGGEEVYIDLCWPLYFPNIK